MKLQLKMLITHTLLSTLRLEEKTFHVINATFGPHPPFCLPAHAWGVWRCDLCVFSVVFVCCHLSLISSWAPFLIFASSLDLPWVQPGQLADWLCVLRWGLWLVTNVVNQRKEGGCSARFCILFTNQQL